MKKSALILVDRNGFTQRTLTVSNHFALHWKKYFVGFITVFLLLGLGIGYAIYKGTNLHYTNRIDQLERANAGAVEEFTSLFQTMDKVDVYVAKINSLLRIKGMEEYATPALEESTQDSKALLAANLSSLSAVAKELDETPIGLPHNGRITSHFGSRRDPLTGAAGDNHNGIDFKGAIGEPVISTAQGKVVQAGRQNGYGNCVVVEHKNGVKTLYAHLNRISVSENQEVKTGTKVGELGNTGRSTGSHLHYEVIENGQKVNPAKYMKL